jgi:hypothetical protein
VPAGNGSSCPASAKRGTNGSRTLRSLERRALPWRRVQTLMASSRNRRQMVCCKRCTENKAVSLVVICPLQGGEFAVRRQIMRQRRGVWLCTADPTAHGHGKENSLYILMCLIRSIRKSSEVDAAENLLRMALETQGSGDDAPMKSPPATSATSAS